MKLPNILHQNTNRLKVKVAKVLYYKEESMWGIVSVAPTKIEDDFEPELNRYNNFVIRGYIPMAMNVGQEYDIEVSDLQTDAKYGEFYEIIRIHVEALDTVEAQQRFLQAVLSEYQSKLIIEAFPNNMIVDDIRDNIIDITTIKGFGEATALKIKREIKRNKDLGALISELADLNPSGRMLNKIVEKFGNSTIALYKAKESLYYLCIVSGLSFKRIDNVALMRGEDKFGAKRIKAYSEYYFDELANQGHSWVNEREFLEQAIKELDVNGTYIRKYMKSEDGKKNFYWQQEDKRISSILMYNNERNILRNLLRLATRYEAPIGFDVDEAIKDAEAALDVKYTEEQKNAICESVLHGVFIINGKGGTGKTTVVKGIVEVLNSLGLTYKACALSGKASQVLLSKDIDSATIHRTFGIGIKKSDDDEIGDGKSFYDVIIIDESSMVDAGLFSQMLSKVQDGAKVILVGDSGQLSGIGHGDVLRDLLQTQYFKTIELNQVHRQAQDSGIIELATKIREGVQVCSANQEGMTKFGKNEDMIMVNYQNKEDMPENVERVLRGQAKNIKTPKDLMDFQVVVAMKERGAMSAKAINNLAQSVFNDLEKPFVSHNGYDFREGDKVIVKGNSYEISYYDDLEHYYNVRDQELTENEIQEHLSTLETDEERIEFYDSIPTSNTGDLFNGTMGIIVDVFEKMDYNTNKIVQCLMINFEGLGIKVYQQSELDSLELAYTVTCHRIQGSTIKNVVVILDYSAYSLLCRQWVYTAITRASKKCVFLVQSSALVKAIGTDASGNRQTFLGDMIRELHKAKGDLETVIKQVAKLQ
ncbi:AAA family ATPase [Lysinibacillus sp. M3]|uniref:AAA family ATPase n=1 Tax=Lysinibacillus zambalensis TaxID=3160866 RepID=A0ABV1MVK3_9BACI